MRQIVFLFNVLFVQQLFICTFLPTAAATVTGLAFKTYHNWNGYQITTLVDLNADRILDIILTDDTGVDLYAVILPDAKSSNKFTMKFPTEQEIPPMKKILSPGFDEPIRSVDSADFDGDSRADLLISTSSSPSGPFRTYISYGLGGSQRGEFGPVKSLAEFVAVPLICDLNSDMIADVYGETISHERTIFFGGNEFSNSSSAYEGPMWSPSSYSVCANINADGVPDIAIVVEDNPKKIQFFERTQSSIGNLPDHNTATLISFPNTGNILLGPPSLADFDADGKVEMLFTACTSSSCLDSSVAYMYSFETKAWINVDVNWNVGESDASEPSKWSLCPTSTTRNNKLLTVSEISVSTPTDLNLDGLPDLGVCLVRWSQSGAMLDKHAGLLLNMGMNNSGHLVLNSNSLSGMEPISSSDVIRQMVFFDHSQDSISDMIFVTSDASEKQTSRMLLHVPDGDPYFLKVTVLNGLYSSALTCSDGRLPYGLVVPGVSASLDTETPTGTRQLSKGLLGVQGLGASQVSFYIFGLGEFANYVENLKIMIPSSAAVFRSRLFTFLPPKSQIMVNPYPPDNPDKWTSKLFLQPLYDMKVVYIAITLVSICILLLIVIGILQWLEVREDLAEKHREAQRFHFDAL